MPVRKNGYYADPALGTAFDNLAEVFKTPSGADIYGYAKGAAEREKAARLSDLYNYAKDPNYDQTRADRLGVAAGQYAPSQSYYAVDEGNDTSLKTNAATNAATLAVADKNNAGALARQFAQPVILSDGQTAALPAQTVAATGLPAMFRGNVTTNPGQTVTTPTGEVIAGTPKPMTKDEVVAAALGRLPQNEQRAVALQGVGVSSVLDAKGEPTNVLTPDAAGRTPFVQDTRQPQIANYKTPDQKIGTARLDKDTNKWVDTQTGAELPAGSQTYTANLQGDKDATGLGVSTKNNVDQQMLDLALTESTGKQLRKIVTSNPAVQGLSGHIRGTIQDVLQAGGEVGQLFNVNMEKLKQDAAAGRFDPEVAKKFTNYDPNIPATAMLETLLTAQVAKVLDPNGRISNDRYKQVGAALGAGGWTGNTAKTIATLDALDAVIADHRRILSPISPAGAKIGQTAAAPAAAAPAAPAAPAIRTWNPATGALE
ncbi:MAG: hypothetical protein ACXWLZ_00040 [Rhizomicrobium sp.]